MRTARRKIRFSTIGLLERVWMHKRVKTPVLALDFPDLSPSVLFRSLMALRAAGFVRTYLTSARGRLGRPPRFWTITERGNEALRSLTRYRDLWELLENRDLVQLGRGILIIERLESAYKTLFPDGRLPDPRGPYFVRHF